jgi:ribosomal-protein-alanine N-acetyltransferase
MDDAVAAASAAVTSPARAARREDAPGLHRIEQQVSPNAWSLQRLESLCAGDSPLVLVMESDTGEVCGFAVIEVVLDEGSIHNIAVAPDSQRRGLGQGLLQEVLTLLRQEGARRCLLEVRASNVAAIALYEKRGFAVDGTRKAYYKTATGREDGLLMSLAL